MNKLDLITHVADQADLSKLKAASVVDAVLGAIGEALQRHENVRLLGFGTFVATSRKPVQGHNPRTGEVITVPASTAIRFKPGKALKDLVN